LGLIFFSLTPEEANEYRKNLYNTIHDIVFFGKGGFDYYIVYSMPIWLRKLTHSKINDFYVQQNKQGKSEDLVSQTERLKKTGEYQKHSPPSEVKNAYESKTSKTPPPTPTNTPYQSKSSNPKNS